jgi:hypothetical protein
MGRAGRRPADVLDKFSRGRSTVFVTDSAGFAAVVPVVELRVAATRSSQRHRTRTLAWKKIPRMICKMANIPAISASNPARIKKKNAGAMTTPSNGRIRKSADSVQVVRKSLRPWLHPATSGKLGDDFRYDKTKAFVHQGH